MSVTGLGTALTMLLGLASSVQERSGMVDDPGERKDMPPVSDRPTAADPDATRRMQTAQFANWSRRHGNPRILLFWNIALTDEASSRSRQRVLDDSVAVASPGRIDTRRDVTIEEERTTGGPAASIAREEGGQLEDGFVQAFVDAGANLVDRAALMRKASASQALSDRSDQQFIETLAMQQGVDYLVEVLPEYNSQSTTGMRFAVRILHLPTSKVVTRFRSDGRPVAGPERLIARAGGFRRERDERLTSHAIAASLAAETMQRFQ